MRITLFRKADGSEVAFTHPQRVALERAKLFRGYELITSLADGKPTHTDAEVATMLASYTGMTRITRTDRKLGDPTHPFIVINPGGTDAACETITTALDVVKDLKCDVVTIAPEDMRTAFYGFALERGVTVLVA